MSIECNIQPRDQYLQAICQGQILPHDLAAYLSDWKQHGTGGFKVLFDASEADLSGIEFSHVLDFAEEISKLDMGRPQTKTAVVISPDNPKNVLLVNFYKSARELLPGNNRTVQKFYSRSAAEEWLCN
jgi:hypothetical protein